MHKKLPKYYYFIDTFNKEHIKNLDKNIAIIFRNYIKNPSLLFYRKEMTIKFHFDIFHKYQIIEEASQLLNIDDRDDFLKYIKT